MVRGAGFGRLPVNQRTYIGSKDLLMPEKTHGRSMNCARRDSVGLFELLGRPIAERGVKPLAVVITLDEIFDVRTQVIAIAVIAGIDLLVLERFHEAFATGVGQGSQLQLMATLATVVLKSSIHIIR